MPAPIRRYVEGQLFTSTGQPALRLKVKPALHYVGHTEFHLKGLARVDRQVWVEAPDQHLIRRMLILQFEGFLEGNAHTYNYRPVNPIALGGEVYGHSNYAFSIAANIAEEPEAEIAHTARFLASHGYELADEHMTSRFARVIDAERRNELIIFYHENVREAGLSLATLAVEGEFAPAHAELKEALTRRSLESFMIV